MSGFSSSDVAVFLVRFIPLRLALVAIICGWLPASAATYFVDPATGDDTRTGTSAKAAWKTFEKVNAIKLGPGDRLLIAPGIHTASLNPKAQGSTQSPVVIAFLPGTHEFAVEGALRRPLHVSNACDDPTTPKPLGILIENCAHLRLQGAGLEGDKKTLLLMGGRMVQAANLTSEDISYKSLVFDLKRPTVSEFRVMAGKPGQSEIRLAEGSTVDFKNGKLSWSGDLGSGSLMAQQATPEKRTNKRLGSWDPFAIAQSTEDLGSGNYRLKFKDDYQLPTGDQFQFRYVLRDSVGIFNARSKGITFEDCDVYALTNMGFVSQFTENITYRRVRVAPPKGTLRTCPAWGDIFQFSNCKGTIRVEECIESGMQDDAINCHGTHLRIVGKPAANQLTLRYMHPQTYGFAPFIAGDEVAVIDHLKLRELPDTPRRKVTDCVQSDKDGRVWTVTLNGSAPAYSANNVVDNITWHPNLLARNNTVDMCPVRGFLLTTRGKVIVEGNTFFRCASPGILLEDDARGWFESTCVRDMTIRGNTFVSCGIDIHPQTTSKDPLEPVHENIRIEDNVFDGGGISARGTKNLTIRGNKSPDGKKVSANVDGSCSEVKAD